MSKWTERQGDEYDKDMTFDYWVNNPLITPENKVALYDQAIYDAGMDGYREGLAWEQKRIELEWELEMRCDCEDAMGHMKKRINGEK